MSRKAMPARSDWLVPALLILFSVVPAIGGVVRVTDLAGSEATAANARFHAMPLPIVLHIIAVIPYSIVGALQFSRGFRKHNRPWHRQAGKVIALCGMVAALTGLWMTLAYPEANNDGVAVFVQRLIVGVVMAVSLVLGVDAVVRRRDFQAHGAWMIRAYALGMGAATQVLTHLPWFILVDNAPPELPRGVMMGAGWAINAVFAEWIIRRGARGRAVPARAAARGSSRSQVVVFTSK